jgi:DNA polymerase III epsilon subunit-like protein
VVVNQGAIDGDIELLIWDETALVEADAMKVHGIPIARIIAEGLAPHQAVAKLEQFLARHDLMRGDVVLAGHNAPFDVGFLRRLYRLANADFLKRFSYRSLCTQTGALLLEQAGRIVLPGGSASLDALCKLWNLQRDTPHNALTDARATAAILKRMVYLLQGEPKPA